MPASLPEGRPSLGAAVLPLPVPEARFLQEGLAALRDPALRASLLRRGSLPPAADQALRMLDDSELREGLEDLRRAGSEAEARTRRSRVGARLRARYPEAVAAWQEAHRHPGGTAGRAGRQGTELIIVTVPSNTLTIIIAHGPSRFPSALEALG